MVYRLIKKFLAGDTCDAGIKLWLPPPISDATNHRGAARKLILIRLEPTQPPLAERPLTPYHHELGYILLTDQLALSASRSFCFNRGPGGSLIQARTI